MSTFLMVVAVWVGWVLVAGGLCLAGMFCWLFWQERRERRPGYLDDSALPPDRG
jgi:heme A synthase